MVVLGLGSSLVAQMKNLPAMQEPWVQSLGWKDFPGEGSTLLKTPPDNHVRLRLKSSSPSPSALGLLGRIPLQ